MSIYHHNRGQITGPNHILLVEDNPGDVRLTREAFTDSSSDTTLDVATTGEDAIEYLTETSDDHAVPIIPDLVLLDLNLPGKTGYEVLSAIRDHSHINALPVIVLTSSDADEDILRSYEAKANAYLTKPSTPDEFASVVETIEQFWFSHVKLPSIAP